MAAGDITYDTKSIHSAGDHFVITGEIEADTTARTFAIAGTGRYLLYCNLTSESAVGASASAVGTDAQCVINVTSDMATAQNGSIGEDAEAAKTYRFTAGLI